MADSNPVATLVPVPIDIAGNVTGNVTGNATGDVTRSDAAHLATIINWVTFSIGLPAIALAIYTLKNLSKGDTKVPTHVMFLLVSDIVSFFGRPRVDPDMPEEDSDSSSGILSSNATNFIFNFGVVSNVTLMLFIAQEHHLRVAYPQCLGCCGSIRRSPAVTFMAFGAPFAILALVILDYDFWFAVCLLAPFPILLFFAVDSWRALLICPGSNPPSLERRRAVWGISAIWANYTVLYVPFVLSVLLEALAFKETVVYLGLVSHLLLYLSPLVDPFLYILMTKGLREVLQALPCRHTSGRKQDNVSRATTVDTVAESVETRL